MPIKNILLHMANDDAHMVRFETAVLLAKLHGAHLEIAYLTSPAGMPAAIQGRGASAAYIAEATAIAREKAQAVEVEIIERCKAEGIRWNWEVLDGDHNELLAAHSYYADLIVVSEDHGWVYEGHVGIYGIDELVAQSACATLVLPVEWEAQPVGRRVLIAWKDVREAAHAVRDAMPLIENADTVFVLTTDKPHSRFESGADLATYLRRHDIKARQESDVMERGDVAKMILSHAEDLKADLIVLGAYSRPRWREALLGGVTRDMLNKCPIPIVMSH